MLKVSEVYVVLGLLEYCYRGFLHQDEEESSNCRPKQLSLQQKIKFEMEMIKMMQINKMIAIMGIFQIIPRKILQ